MNLEELLGTIRDLYLERYQEALDERENDPGTTIHLEPILLDDAGDPVLDGKLELPLRGDLFVAVGEELQGYAVDSTSMMDFDPFSFELDDGGGTTFYIEPFVWDHLEITFGGLDAERTDWTPLSAWYLAWFDENDGGEENEDDDTAKPTQFAEVVHCLSDPEPTPDGAVVSIDLGTAPVAAIEDLLAAIQMLGPTTCHLASANIADEDEGEANGDGKDD